MYEFIVGGYPPGSDLTILNAIYRAPMKIENSNKRTVDSLLIVYKDNRTGVKKYEVINEPEYTWYLAKKDVPLGPHTHFLERDQVIPITCKYKDIIPCIAQNVGLMDLYKTNIQNGQYSSNKLFFLHPRVFSADLPMKNYVRSRFAETYLNPVIPITKLYFDTEADVINALSDNITIGAYPTNMIGMYFTGNDTMYVLILRNSKNPLIEEFEKNIEGSDLDIQLHEQLIQHLGSEEKVKKFGFENTTLKIGFFDDEKGMLATFFFLIKKKLNPDIVTAWNLFGYDLPQLIGRIQSYGLPVEGVVCDLDIPIQFCDIRYDEKNRNKPEERTDVADISMMPVWLDQEIVYASRRKGQSAIESYALDYVGNLEAGVRKLDYSDLTTNIAKFPWLDFERFFWYNVFDVVAQRCIDVATDDFNYMFNNVIEMHTPYEKIFRQTNFLWTKGQSFYKNHENVIMGDNHNRFGNKPSEKFPGAFVASPLLMSDKNKVKIKGQPIMKFLNANDFDYKALYPSLLREFNMAPHTQVGMIKFDEAPYEDPAFLKIEPGGTFNENLASYNFIEFAHRWMNLANVDEILEDFNEYFNNYRTPMYKGEGNLKYDKSYKVVAYKEDKSSIISKEKPMPDWIKQEVDKIRSDIFSSMR